MSQRRCRAPTFSQYGGWTAARRALLIDVVLPVLELVVKAHIVHLLKTSNCEALTRTGRPHRRHSILIRRACHLRRILRLPAVRQALPTPTMTSLERVRDRSAHGHRNSPVSGRVACTSVVQLLALADLPTGFTYPPSFIRVVHLGLIDLEPWAILSGDPLQRRFRGLAGRFPNRRLVPFCQPAGHRRCCLLGSASRPSAGCRHSRLRRPWLGASRRISHLLRMAPSDRGSDRI